MASWPVSAILLGQGDRVSVCIEPRISAGIVERQEREQARHLGLARVGFDERTSEPDREPAKVRSDRGHAVTRPVAFVEEQVNGAEHGEMAAGEEQSQEVVLEASEHLGARRPRCAPTG